MLKIESRHLLRWSSFFFLFFCIRSRFWIFFQILNGAVCLGVLSLLWTLWKYEARLHTVSNTSCLKGWKFSRNTVVSGGSYGNSGAKESGVQGRPGIALDGPGRKPSKSSAVLKTFFSQLWHFSRLSLSAFGVKTEAWYFKIRKPGRASLALAAHTIQASGPTREADLWLQSSHRDAEAPLNLVLSHMR